MAFALIRPQSRAFLERAGTADARIADADRAATVLRADVERWSRWWLGLLAFTAAVAGAFVAVGFAATLLELGATPHPLDLGALVGSLLIALAGAALLLTLWWSGRRVHAAVSWWLRLPYTEGGRPRRAAGWLRARLVNLEPRVLVRLVSGTLALLLAVGALALVARDLVVGTSPMTAAALAVGLIALASALGQLGGVLRFVSAVAEADPLWARIRP